jgi:hypothetical protein
MQRVPQPLTSVEIKDGAAILIAKELNAPDELRDAIRRSLDRTCSLNSISYSAFEMDWTVRLNTDDQIEWWINYSLDDFGRLTTGGIGGTAPPTHRQSWKLAREGKIERMPPDAFRRLTTQKIPSPTVIQKKAEDGVGFTQTPRGKREKKTA